VCELLYQSHLLWLKKMTIFIVEFFSHGRITLLTDWHNRDTQSLADTTFITKHLNSTRCWAGLIVPFLHFLRCVSSIRVPYFDHRSFWLRNIEHAFDSLKVQSVCLLINNIVVYRSSYLVFVSVIIDVLFTLLNLTAILVCLLFFLLFVSFLFVCTGKIMDYVSTECSITESFTRKRHQTSHCAIQSAFERWHSHPIQTRQWYWRFVSIVEILYKVISFQGFKLKFFGIHS